MIDEENRFEDSNTYKEIDEILTKFEEDLAGLPKWQKNEAPEILSVSLDVLKRKSPDELSEYGFLLKQYSLHIQRLLNKQKAFIRWANSKLDELEAYYIGKIAGNFGFNERPKIARQEPLACKRLNTFLRKMNMEADMLYDLPNQISVLADTLRDMKFVALKRERENHESD